MTSMAPPVFGLTAGIAEEGGGNGDGVNKKSVPAKANSEGYTLTVSEMNAPFEMVSLPFKGQIAWVHSPCFSQEIEAIAMQTANGGDFITGASQISNTIIQLSQMPFRNAGGTENDWAKRMMGNSVVMNPENKAATIVGNGYPKVVVLTFWNDPSNPGKGGVNYSYFVEIDFETLIPNSGHDGGMILMGPSGPGLDLGHVSKSVVEINEWMAKVLEFMKACQSGMRPDPRKLPKNVPEAIKDVLGQTKNIAEGADKAGKLDGEIEKQEIDARNKRKFENEKYIEIDGMKLERQKRYNVSFTLDGVKHTGHKTPNEFLDEYGIQYHENLITKVVFREL